MLPMADFGNKKRNAHWNWLLILRACGLLFPAIYARETPTLFGFPFFYWYQFRSEERRVGKECLE